MDMDKNAIDSGPVRTIAAIGRNEPGTRVAGMEFVLLENGINLKNAIRDACRDYVMGTRRGWEDWTSNGRHFDWADFLARVPNDVCVRHGFMKLSGISSENIVDLDECLVDRNAVRLDDRHLTRFAKYIVGQGTTACERVIMESGYIVRVPPKLPEDKTRTVKDALSWLDPEKIAEYYFDNVAYEKD